MVDGQYLDGTSLASASASDYETAIGAGDLSTAQSGPAFSNFLPMNGEADGTTAWTGGASDNGTYSSNTGTDTSAVPGLDVLFISRGAEDDYSFSHLFDLSAYINLIL